jgi:leader peptidase (prepilin peptidase)/N-methyltransferase
MTGALFAAVVIAAGASRNIWLDLIFVAALVAITLIDLEHQIIPNRILAPLALAAVVLTAVLQPHLLGERLIAGAAAGGFLLVAVLAYPAGMGMGDVKLAAVMGLVLGRAVAPALMIALIAGTVAGVAVMARKGVTEGRRTRIPFGPFLALGSVVAIFAGDAIVNAYLHGAGL